MELVILQHKVGIGIDLPFMAPYDAIALMMRRRAYFNPVPI